MMAQATFVIAGASLAGAKGAGHLRISRSRGPCDAGVG